jgi:predicted glycoside hydrolase/deacetylase ChbG (UPF0249 family)
VTSRAEDRKPRVRPGGGVLLVADDFAMTNGVSRAIIELAEAGRISATSAMTTSAHWPSHATWLARARGDISAGLHLNLTLGSPLGAMGQFAPDRRFPGIGVLTAAALRGTIERDEIKAEIARQLAAFEAEVGFPPDHIDGHQHVHALPGIRDVVLEVLAQRFSESRTPPLLRDPGDVPSRTLMRRRGAVKAMTLAWLSRGFARAALAAGFPCNSGFSGVTDFNERQVDVDFAAAVRSPGAQHLVMCHPGFVDEELERIDPVTLRRQREFDVLMREGFPAAIWRPQRRALGEPIDWTAAWTGTALE